MSPNVARDNAPALGLRSFSLALTGRAFAVVLMIFGVGLFGLLAASLASFLIEREISDPQDEDPQYREILERLERIERHLDSKDDRGPT